MTTADLVVRDSGGIRTLELGPERRRNALSMATRFALAEQLVAADADPTVLVIVITGAGTAFCAGADINEVPRGLTADDAHRYMTESSQVVARALAALTTPTIARVDGVAAGAGMFLALGCDIVIASDRATFVPSQLRLGLPPDWYGLWLLPRLVGRARAKAILLRAEPVTAGTAAAIGMIAECVAPERLDEVVTEYCERISALPALAVSLVKEGLDRQSDHPVDRFAEWEADAVALALTSDEYEHRVNDFLTKHPASPKPTEPQRTT
jgi:2-(1,2-epoxy-1,2-dihydrophenyl)acetyl-CoA isomerase